MKQRSLAEKIDVVAMNRDAQDLSEMPVRFGEESCGGLVSVRASLKNQPAKLASASNPNRPPGITRQAGDPAAIQNWDGCPPLPIVFQYAVHTAENHQPAPVLSGRKDPIYHSIFPARKPPVKCAPELTGLFCGI